MAANRIISVTERTEQIAQMIRTTMSVLLGRLCERSFGVERKGGCVRLESGLESGISVCPDGGGYEGEHEDELEGPERNEDSFEPGALGVVAVVHAVRCITALRINAFELVLNRNVQVVKRNVRKGTRSSEGHFAPKLLSLPYTYSCHTSLGLQGQDCTLRLASRTFFNALLLFGPVSTQAYWPASDETTSA